MTGDSIKFLYFYGCWDVDRGGLEGAHVSLVVPQALCINVCCNSTLLSVRVARFIPCGLIVINN